MSSSMSHSGDSGVTYMLNTMRRRSKLFIRKFREIISRDLMYLGFKEGLRLPRTGLRGMLWESMAKGGEGRRRGDVCGGQASGQTSSTEMNIIWTFATNFNCVHSKSSGIPWSKQRFALRTLRLRQQHLSNATASFQLELCLALVLRQHQPHLVPSRPVHEGSEVRAANNVVSGERDERAEEDHQ